MVNRITRNRIFSKTVTYLIAMVWIVNGMLCKVLNLVPRHQEIVGHILGNQNAYVITKLIGISEIIMALWILSKYQSKVNAIAQIVIIATMNTIEFTLVPDLLLWGKMNAVFAFLFIIFIYCNEFIWKNQRN